MIVCHCTGATDRDIRSLVRMGQASTALEICRVQTAGMSGKTAQKNCAAGLGCGGCFEAIEQIVELARQEERSRNGAVLVELATVL